MIGNGKMIFYGLFSLISHVIANTGVFTEQYNRIFASGHFNNQQPLLNVSHDLNNVTINSMFDTGVNVNYILQYINSESVTDLQACETFCSINPSCAGLFIKDNENYNYQFTSIEPSSISTSSTSTTTSTGFNMEREYKITCNALSNLGNEMDMPDNYTSESYKKTLSYSNSSSTDIDIILLNFWSSEGGYIPYNTTIYFDLNNNNMLDEGELNKTVSVYDFEFVSFENLAPQVYHIRQIIHDGTCEQVYPGLEGNYFFVRNEVHDHFVDMVVNWESSMIGHHQLRGGRVVDGEIDYSSPNLEYILGNSPDTFLSFCPGESITVSFVDDVIINREGDDLFFNLYEINNTQPEEGTYGNVYISYNNIDWTYIGNVSSSSNSIDLTLYNYQSHANYLRIDFLGDNHNEFLNISSIELGSYKRYYQPFAATIDTSINNFGVFFNDCHNTRYCDDYCNLNFYENSDYFSCLVGCDTFIDNYYCKCDLNSTSEIEETGFNLERYEYNSALCYNGCAFYLDTYLDTDMYAFPGRKGNNKYLIDTNITNNANFSMSGEYLLQLFDICNNNENCRGFTVDEYGTNLYSKLYERVINPDSIFLVKLGEYSTPTTTQTTTQTTSATTSQTTSATTSQTTSATTSQTTSATTSQTTSATTSQTTSATTSQTSTKSSTQTTTQTTTPTIKFTENSRVLSEGEITGIVFLVLFIVFGMILGVWFFRKGKIYPLINNQTHNINSYDNPIYDADMETAISGEGIYTDVPVNPTQVESFNEDGYLDVAPDISNGVTTFYNDGMESPEIINSNIESDL